MVATGDRRDSDRPMLKDKEIGTSNSTLMKTEPSAIDPKEAFSETNQQNLMEQDIKEQTPTIRVVEAINAEEEHEACELSSEDNITVA